MNPNINISQTISEDRKEMNTTTLFLRNLCYPDT